MARAVGDHSLKWVAAQELTISYASLADGAYVASSELDLSALDNVIDVLVGSKHKTQAGTLATDPFIQLYALAPLDGTNYPAQEENYRPVGPAIFVETANSQEYSNLYSVAEAFGGVLPNKLKIAVLNSTNIAMSATANECEIYYVLVYANTFPA